MTRPFVAGIAGLVICAAAMTTAPVTASAQVTRADYERVLALRDTLPPGAINLPAPPTWVGESHRFVYRKSVADGFEFVMVDAETARKTAPFDHARLAAVLSEATGETYSAHTLPFNDFRFADNERAIDFARAPGRWTCVLATYHCTYRESPPPAGALRGVNGPVRGGHTQPAGEPVRSPDGKWDAIIQNYNLAVRPATGGKPIVLSDSGTEGDAYELDSVRWSPDSTRLAAYRVKPGYQRFVNYVESSPEDQLQPRHWTLQYAKPGDVLDREMPAIFHLPAVGAGLQTGLKQIPKQIDIAPDLFPNPYELSALVWRKDSRAVTFEYNQRGHQVFRVIEADAATGKTRAVVSEEPRTFFYYNAANDTRSAGKRFRHDVNDGAEVVWMSERDGWNHLYLLDGTSGAVKNQITTGAWAVRGVQKVDETRRQIWFSAGGMYPGRDPYFLHYYRINFDGSGLTTMTEMDADHQVAYSPDMTFFVDTYSRVDLPTVSELRRTPDRSLIAQIEKGDITALVKSGWKAPEVFTAKGRDGATDIWGLIFKPAHFDAAKKYPVIENIYAGPHGSHVPKNFDAYSSSQAQADLGFIVVQIDGMGTSNRSKAFHDVAWQNLGDAGFPDRILWHKAAAAKFPYYDITRVGIYGGSAGGQNALGALLFHPELYKVAVAFAGCHDNRMDKIWWNEQWMGWPIGQQYSASSNVDNAARLQGKLLLIYGELDTNVDPSSTLQVASALIKADKVFDLLVVPGANHGAGRSDGYASYGDRKRFDFFVQHLLGQQPPDWNGPPAKSTTSTPAGQ